MVEEGVQDVHRTPLSTRVGRQACAPGPITYDNAPQEDLSLEHRNFISKHRCHGYQNFRMQ
jgi:hypothetical protein